MARWIFYIIGIFGLIMAAVAVASIRSDIQLTLAAVFGLYALVAFGFGALMKRREG